jgi:competence protein ComEC
MTIAATAATAPLIAHAFERFSIASLPANLVVLPAVAPVMWVGMLIGLLAQLPHASPLGLDPIVALGWAEGRLVGFVAGVAALFARPTWAQVALPLPATAAVVASYAAVAAAMGAAIGTVRRRAGIGPPPRMAAAALAAIPLALLPALGGAADAGPPPGVLRITALDVGQGDAILIRPPRGAPVLVDGGPPGTAAAEELRALGVDRLRAVFVTHDQLDHAGGIPAVLERVPTRILVHGRPAREAEAAARGSGARVVRTAEGGSFDFGPLELDVLWPPRERLRAPPVDPNLDALVLAVRFRGYDALLPADAEEEATHLDPGPIDVLKVAHHGSDDAGLESLLERSVPRVALISVGHGNSYGHPTESTLATLAERGVCVLRTDVDGSVTAEIGAAGVVAYGEDGPPPADRPGCGGSG